MAGSLALMTEPIRPPSFSSTIFPTLPTLGLTGEEQAAITRLQSQWRYDLFWMLLTQTYYDGMQVVANLGIAIPPELQVLRTIVGWPKIAVDPYVERLSNDGFRLAGATDSDTELGDIWDGSGMSAEQSLAFTDALTLGRGWLTVGSGDDPGDMPRICVESPLNMSAEWDARDRPKALLQTYWEDLRWHAALLLPNGTVHLVEGDNGTMEIVDRDQHNFGMVPAIRMPNNPRTNRRDGVSEITPELMSITDAACRSVLGLEVAGEFYSIPQKLIMGASESDFQNADGTVKSAWKTYISHILALERDEDGNLPEVHQFTAYDPSIYTKVVEMFASQAAGILAAPPQDLGLYTEGNPVSADAQQVSEGRRDRRARRKQAIFGVKLVETMQMAVRFMNAGDLPDKYRRMVCDWAPPEMPNLAATTDAVTKQIIAGAIPPTSDVTLKKLGWNSVERQRLAQDRQTAQGDELLNQLVAGGGQPPAPQQPGIPGQQPGIPGRQPVTPGQPNDLAANVG